MATWRRSTSWLLMLGLVTAVLTLVPAARSSAAVDHRATLDAESPSFTWEGSATGVPDPTDPVLGRALPCTGTPPYECDHVVLDVDVAGDLTLTVDTTGAVETTDPVGVLCPPDEPCIPVQDLDGFLYESTVDGQPMGPSLVGRACATGKRVEVCTVSVVPGTYVVEVQAFAAVAAAYVGTVELAPAPPPEPDPLPTEPPVEPQTLPVEDCSFTLYYFMDSAERLQALVPEEYLVRPYPGVEGSGTIAAAAYDCESVALPDGSVAPAIFTVLSVLVYPPSGSFEGPANSDFYVLWVHADHLGLVDLLTAHGMPAHHVPDMVFEKPLLSVAVRVDVPWSAGPFELGTTGYHQDVFHPHDNTFLHLREDGSEARMSFKTPKARDHFCYQPSEIECGTFHSHEGSPVVDLFGASERSADNAWDHDPVPHAWFVLN